MQIMKHTQIKAFWITNILLNIILWHYYSSELETCHGNVTHLHKSSCSQNFTGLRRAINKRCGINEELIKSVKDNELVLGILSLLAWMNMTKYLHDKNEKKLSILHLPGPN